MWAFCLQSFFREYGWQFLKQVALPHPVKTARALFTSESLDFSEKITSVSAEKNGQILEHERSIVGVGFCLKPMNPICISGRPNHDCYYLENLFPSETLNIPQCCRRCVIREIGIMTLKANAAFYIMTSASDILSDVFTPSLNERRFTSGFFILCRYSMRSFAVGLLVSGIRGRMFPFESGDCLDYKTWLLADRGIKGERTEINEMNLNTIREILTKAVKDSMPDTKFEKRGNILYPGRGC